MKKKGNAFWWFRRKKRPVFINVKDENKQNNVIKINQEQSNNKEKENTNTSPIQDIKIKETPQRKKIIKEEIRENERDTLIKPKRNIGLENTIEIKKQDQKNEEKDEITLKEEVNKDFDLNDKLDNDVAIITNTLDEIEKMLRINYNEIQNIKYELEQLEEKEEDEILLEEVEKLIEELNKLIKKFEEIKKDFYHQNFKEIHNHSTNDNYIGLLIEEYKTSLKDNNIKQSELLQIKQIEEYISLINSIIDIEKDKDKLDEKLNDKKEKFEYRDSEFDILKDKTEDVEKVNEYINKFSNEYDLIIKEIEYKIKNSTTVTKKAEYKAEVAINYTRLLTSTLLLGSSVAIPFNRSGNLLKMGLMMASVAGIASSIRTRTRETKTTTTISYIDYKNNILANINNVNDMSLMIDKAIVDIKDIRNEFMKEIGEYIDEIPEFYTLMSDLDSVEKDLLSKQTIAKEYDKKLEIVLEENNVKVKRLEEEFPN